MEYRACNRVDENVWSLLLVLRYRDEIRNTLLITVSFSDRFSSKPDLVRLATSSVIENFIAPQLAHLPRAYGFPAECSNTEIELKLRHGEPFPAPSHCIFTIRPGHARRTARIRNARWPITFPRTAVCFPKLLSSFDYFTLSVSRRLAFEVNRGVPAEIQSLPLSVLSTCSHRCLSRWLFQNRDSLRIEVTSNSFSSKTNFVLVRQSER